MSPKEFEKLRLAIQRERYQGEFESPISYAIARAEFEQHRYMRLIEEANKVTPATRIVQRKMAQWHRQCERAAALQARLRKTQELSERGEISAETLSAIAA